MNDLDVNDVQLVRIVYTIAIEPNGIELLLKNDLVGILISLFTSLSLDSIDAKQSDISYRISIVTSLLIDYLARIDSKELLQNTIIYLGYIIFIVILFTLSYSQISSDPQVISIINNEYPGLYNQLLSIIADPSYGQIAVVLLYTLFLLLLLLLFIVINLFLIFQFRVKKIVNLSSILLIILMFYSHQLQDLFLILNIFQSFAVLLQFFVIYLVLEVP